LIDYRSDNWRLFMAHRWGLACGPTCEIHAPNNPVENDPWNLQRFIEAQDADDTYERAVAELTAGRKETHWMWFIFPQLWGISDKPSRTTTRFSLASPAEVRAYLENDTLRRRLDDVALQVWSFHDRDITEVFGTVDAEKLHASMTLFHAVGGRFTEIYHGAIYNCFSGPHQRTLEVLRDHFPHERENYASFPREENSWPN